MAITITKGFNWTSGATAMPTRLNLSQTGLVINAAANSLLGCEASAGAITEITCTAAGRALIAGTDAEAQRATLEVSDLIATLETDKLIGRISSGTGAPEAITCTDFAQSLLDDTSAHQARITLGILDAAVRCTSQLETVSETTFADIPGLTVNVVAGTTYTIEGRVLHTGRGGCVLRLTGTATASAVSGMFLRFSASTVAAAETTSSLPVDMSSATGLGIFDFAITVVCNGSGTLKLQAKQFGSDGINATSVKTASYLKLLA